MIYVYYAYLISRAILTSRLGRLVSTRSASVNGYPRYLTGLFPASSNAANVVSRSVQILKIVRRESRSPTRESCPTSSDEKSQNLRSHWRRLHLNLKAQIDWLLADLNDRQNPVINRFPSLTDARAGTHAREDFQESAFTQKHPTGGQTGNDQRHVTRRTTVKRFSFREVKISEKKKK